MPRQVDPPPTCHLRCAHRSRSDSEGGRLGTFCGAPPMLALALFLGVSVLRWFGCTELAVRCLTKGAEHRDDCDVWFSDVGLKFTETFLSKSCRCVHR